MVLLLPAAICPGDNIGRWGFGPVILALEGTVLSLVFYIGRHFGAKFHQYTDDMQFCFSTTPESGETAISQPLPGCSGGWGEDQ